LPASACPSHRLDHPFSQLTIGKIANLRPDGNQVVPGCDAARGFRGDRTQTAPNTIAHDCATDLASDGVRDQDVLIIVLRREEVYSDRRIADPAPTALQLTKR
jgi:hypothetical protein